jgi:hypothetical protein
LKERKGAGEENNYVLVISSERGRGEEEYANQSQKPERLVSGRRREYDSESLGRIFEKRMKSEQFGSKC